MIPQSNYNNNIKDHLSQGTMTNMIIVKTFEILWELPKTDRDTKASNAVWQVALVDVLNTKLLQTFNLLKKNEISAKHNKAKCSKMKYSYNKSLPLLPH